MRVYYYVDDDYVFEPDAKVIPNVGDILSYLDMEYMVTERKLEVVRTYNSKELQTRSVHVTLVEIKENVTNVD